MVLLPTNTNPRRVPIQIPIDSPNPFMGFAVSLIPSPLDSDMSSPAAAEPIPDRGIPMLSMDAIHSMHASGSMPTTYMAAAQHTHSHPQAHPQAHPFIAHHGGSPDMGMMMVQHPPAVHDGLHMPVGASNSSGAAAGEKRGYDEQAREEQALGKKKAEGVRKKHRVKPPGPVDYSPQKVEAVYVAPGVEASSLPPRELEMKDKVSRGRTGRPRKSDHKIIKMIRRVGSGGAEWYMKQKGSGRPKKGEEIVRFQVPFPMEVRQDPWRYKFSDGHLETVDETAPEKTPVTLGEVSWEEFKRQHNIPDEPEVLKPLSMKSVSVPASSEPADGHHGGSEYNQYHQQVAVHHMARMHVDAQSRAQAEAAAHLRAGVDSGAQHAMHQAQQQHQFQQMLVSQAHPHHMHHPMMMQQQQQQQQQQQHLAYSQQLPQYGSNPAHIALTHGMRA